MKPRGFNRILIFLGACITAVIAVGLFLISLRTKGFAFPAFGGEDVVISQLMIILCSAYLFIFAIYFISMTLSPRRKKTDFVVQESSGGQLRISVMALDSLVRKVMAAHTEMSLKEMSVENIKDNVFVDLQIDIAGNVSIPLSVASLQKDIRQHLLSSTGIDVKEVKVSVNTTDAMSDSSPFIIHDIASSHEPQESSQNLDPLPKVEKQANELNLNYYSLDEKESKDSYSQTELKAGQTKEGIEKHAGT